MIMPSVVICVGWLAAGCCAWRFGPAALARVAAVLAVVQLAAGLWPVLAPVAVAGWLVAGLTLPTGALGSRARRAGAAVVVAAAATWSGWLTFAARDLRPGWLALAAVFAGTVVAAAVAMRCRRADTGGRRVLQWLAAAAVAMVACGAVVLALNVLLGMPARPVPWVLSALVLLPAGVAFGLFPATARLAERALVEAVVVAGLAVMVVAVYLVVVVGLGRAPVAGERQILLGSIAAALTAVVLALPVRARLVVVGRAMLGGKQAAPEQALATFGARMSRAVPFDELLLQLAESLRATLGPAGAEVWVGTDGPLNLAVSLPERSASQLQLTEKERVVTGRTRVAGPAWLSVWLPVLLADQPPGTVLRVAPATHLGELHGLLVVRRPVEAGDFTDDDEQVLVQLARQVGLALHNMRLDSALQASLQELRLRNAELQASRLRIVSAADASRRKIERDLHDGAQQHLVALSVKLGLARDIVTTDPAAGAGLLEELRGDVQEAIEVLRELAHGVYPPLLRNHGIGQALQAVTRRAALPCEVSVDLPRRYPEELEAAVYFCCLEAVQNAGKYAGPDATVSVRVCADDDRLRFEVRDDGVGFDVESAVGGHGFVNMADRLGAVGGRLDVRSVPGQGTAVCGEVPVTAAALAADRG